eukprot:GEZU01019566.1.p1 GENE.GEZU01019566.1~~GEZU01019566.1.p1  ORF type:complete len:864 (-),score=297.60 GEZU01019566.1:22-2613(-)
MQVGEWKRAETIGKSPMEREGHACEVLGNKMYVFGGRSGVTTWHNDMLVLELESMRWTHPKVEGKNIPNLAGHSMTKIGDKLYIFGGRSGVFTWVNDILVYDSKTESIRAIKPKGKTPAPRQSHSAVAFGNSIFVYGGFDGSSRLGDLHIFDTESETWSQVATTGTAPGPLEGHKAIVSGKDMYIFGGFDGSAFRGNVYALNFETKQWRTFEASKPMAHHIASKVDNLVYLIGGINSKDRLNEVRVFDLDSNKWVTEQSTSGDTLPPRQGHCGAVYGSDVIIFGGSISWTKYYNDVFVLATGTPAPASKIPEQELAAQVDDTLMNVRVLLEYTPETTTGGVSVEIELNKTIVQDTETLEFLGLDEKIVLWRKIGDVYNDMKDGRAELLTYTRDVTIQVTDIERAKNESEHYKKLLRTQEAELRESAANVRALEDQLRDLQRVQQDAIQAHTKSKDRVRDSEKDLTALRDRIAYQESLVDRLAVEATSLQQKLERQLKQRDDFSGLYDALKKNESDITAALDKLRAEISALNDQIEEMRVHNRELGPLIAQLENDLKVFDALDIARLKEMHDRVDAAFRQYLETLQAILEIIIRMDPEANAERDEVKLRDVKWIENFVAQRKDFILKKLAALRAELAGTVDQLQDKLAQLRRMKDEELTLVTGVERIRSRLARYTEDQEEMERLVITADKEWKAVLSNLETHRAEVDALRADIPRREAAIRDAKADADQKAKRVVELTTQEENLRRDLSRAREALMAKLEEIRATYQKAKSALNTLEIKRREITVRKTDYEKRRESIIALGNELRQLLAEAEKEWLQDVARLKRENELLRSQLDTLTAQLDDCNRRLRERKEGGIPATFPDVSA